MTQNNKSPIKFTQTAFSQLIPSQWPFTEVGFGTNPYELVRAHHQQIWKPVFKMHNQNRHAKVKCNEMQATTKSWRLHSHNHALNIAVT